MSATPRNAQKSPEIRCKIGGRKKTRKKRREIDTVGHNVSKRCPKDSPRAPKWSLKRSQNHQKSMLWPARCNRASFSSPRRTLEVGTGLKNTKNLYKIRHNIITNILANPIRNVSTQPLLADIPPDFPPVQAVKPHALFQNSF